MKTKLLLLVATFVSLNVFGQGKISVANDSNRLIYFAATKAADAALIGQPVPAVLPSGTTLTVGLYGGLDFGSMTLQTTTTINASFPGTFGPFGFVSPNIPGGTRATWQVRVWESAYSSAEIAASSNGYFAYSRIFLFTPSSTIAFNSIINQGGTALSTWDPGVVAVPGGFGAIVIGIPEPSTVTIVGLGLAFILAQRRRNSSVGR